MAENHNRRRSLCNIVFRYGEEVYCKRVKTEEKGTRCETRGAHVEVSGVRK